jgi:hypothetical protein
VVGASNVEMKRFVLRWGPIASRSSIGLAVWLLASIAHAQDWKPVADPEALRALFSDTVMEATLAGGAKAVARYDADGTGVLEAWGDTFQRTWAVRGRDQVCITIGRQERCYRVERSAADPDAYRSTEVRTRETLVFTIRPGKEAAQLAGAVPDGGAAEPSAEELAAKLANPNTPLASLTLKLQHRTYQGDLPDAGDQHGTTMLFQPSFPYPLPNGDQILFRPAIPFQFDQPVFDASRLDFDSEIGLGDISFDLAYARTTKGGVLWAAGLISTLPTATNDALGADRYTLGPELLIGKLTKNYVLGVFPNHQWDIGGSGEADINLTSAQVFGTWLSGSGWSVGTSPVLSYDHNANQWTIPLNFSFGKTVILSGRPWKLSAEINYFVEQPDAFGPRWFFGMSVAPVIENPLSRLLQ